MYSIFSGKPTCQSCKWLFRPIARFNPWAKEVMPLIRFKQIRKAFHPEAGLSKCGDKCHQLKYIIRKLNKKAKRIFHLGPNASFDEGKIAMRSRYCPVRQYNKENPNK